MSTEVHPEQQTISVAAILTGEDVPNPGATEEAPQEPEAAEQKSPIEEREEELEVIIPDKGVKQWTIGTGDHAITLNQAPLGFFGKTEFFALLARTLDEAMSGENAMSVAAIMSQVGVDRQNRRLSVSDLADADSFVKAIVKIVGNVPDFLMECYCIWLGVNRGDRPYVKTVMSYPPDQGGLSDEDGLMIIQTFLDQNLEAMESFFGKEMPKMFRRASKILSQGR